MYTKCQKGLRRDQFIKNSHLSQKWYKNTAAMPHFAAISRTLCAAECGQMWAWYKARAEERSRGVGAELVRRTVQFLIATASRL
jgi:hypothetical protein